MTECLYRLHRNIGLLRALNCCTKKQRRAVLQSLAPDQIHCICECLTNILRKNIPVSKKSKKTLKKSWPVLLKLTAKRPKDKKTRKAHFREKKRLLVQNGGFLPLILGPILTAASGLLSGFLSR